MASDAIGWLVVAVFAAPHVAPWAAPIFYVHAERKHRAEWQSVPLRPQVLESAAYRSGGGVVPGHLEKAPGIVRLAAASSILFGAMFIPGLAWGLFGLMFFGLGLLSIPGLILAARLWGAGHGLLRGGQQSAVTAARVATHSLYFNTLLAFGALVVLVTSFGYGDHAAAPLAAFVGSYAMLSFAQAMLVTKAARHIAKLLDEESEWLVESELPSFVRRTRTALSGNEERRAAEG